MFKLYFRYRNNRSSHPRCSVKKGVLRNFTKFTGKHLCQSLFFNKVAVLSPATLLKKRLWHRCFPLNFLEVSKNTCSREQLQTAASEIRKYTIYGNRNCSSKFFKISYFKSTNPMEKILKYCIFKPYYILQLQTKETDFENHDFESVNCSNIY